jgi:hypothetical protein
MKLYKVKLDGNELIVIADDKDHVITIISKALNTSDYYYVINNIEINQVGGPISEDEVNFYANLR